MPLIFRPWIAGLAGALLGFAALGASPAVVLNRTVLATNLTEPIALDVAVDGRVVFAEHHGAVKVWDPGSGNTTSIASLNVFTGPEDGILGLALDPGFATNGWIFLYHSTPGVLENRVSRFTLDHDAIDPGSQKILLRIPTRIPKPNHSGGCLGFDGAGNLYASTGDYTYADKSEGFAPLDRRPGHELNDSERTAANTADFRGKILRIHPEPDGTYTVPAGNLFKPGTPKTLPEIYIMGCRNPFRFTVDPATGWLYWGDVGPDATGPNPTRGPAGFDEFNVARTAGNFGELPPARPAFLWYPPGPSSRWPEVGSGARSAMAGPVYHFDPNLQSVRKLPREFDGAVFLFEWERGWIKAAWLDESGSLARLESVTCPETAKFKRPICMKLGPDGALYLIEWGSNWSGNRDAALVRLEAATLKAGIPPE